MDTIAQVIVDRIIADLRGRKGIGDEWGNVAPDIEAELRQDLISLTEKILTIQWTGRYQASVGE